MMISFPGQPLLPHILTHSQCSALLLLSDAPRSRQSRTNWALTCGFRLREIPQPVHSPSCLDLETVQATYHPKTQVRPLQSRGASCASLNQPPEYLTSPQHGRQQNNPRMLPRHYSGRWLRGMEVLALVYLGEYTGYGRARRDEKTSWPANHCCKLRGCEVKNGQGAAGSPIDNMKTMSGTST